MSGPSFFTQISSFFGGSLGAGPFGNQRKASTFGSGLPSSRRGLPASLNSNAWSLPYSSSYGQDSPTILSPSSSHYPPARATSPYQTDGPGASFSTASIGDFTNLHPSASSSTLVPPPNRHARGGHGHGSNRATEPATSARSATGVMIPSTAYPPLRHTWNRIRGWCDSHYEEIADTLNWPASEEAIDELEMTIGFTLPAAVRESYLCYDGQELESNQSCQDGLFFGLPLLSLEEVAEEWKFWRAVDEDPETGANAHVRAKMSSCPHKWVRPEYACRGWIPLITDRAGNYIGVDLTPYPSSGGAPGQVIMFGRDFDTKVVVWRGEGEGGWGRFLQSFAEELETGEMWSLEEPASGSDDDEDAIGYESYFAGGGAGGASRGGGDRSGEGTAGFRLVGEYKSWPVLEAWADKSIRHWESVGLAPGKPMRGIGSSSSGMAGDEPTPSLRMVDENGEALNAEGSNRSRRGSSVMHADDEPPVVAAASHPLEDASGSALDVGDTSATKMLPSRGSASAVEAIQRDASSESGNGGAGGNLTPTNSSLRVAKMLSPPLPDTRASRKQKQRSEGWGSPQLGSPQLGALQQQHQRRPFRPPPVPAQPLDLPTLDDVKAVHAAVLASDGRSHSVQFDDDLRGQRASYSNPGYRDAGGGGPGGVGGAAAAASSRRVDSLEMDARSSTERATAAPRGNGHVGSGGRGQGNDSSAESTTSTFSAANLHHGDDPLRVDVGMNSVAGGRRSHSSTAATSPRISSEQREPLRINMDASSSSSPVEPDPVSVASEAIKAMDLISPTSAASDDVPALIGTHSLPGSPIKTSFGGVSSAPANPSPLNPAVSGGAEVPHHNHHPHETKGTTPTTESEVSAALA